MTEPRQTETRTRPEIQALRAVAVGAVVLYHFWPPVVTGGYVGVDVFFAISGFLITAHLLREVDRTGRIGLARFWARRARRLLPASLLVLLVTAVAVLVWVPSIFWTTFFRETIASALYVENWVLAGESVDYLAANNVPTAVQHYWSLSAEEQFYLIWPLLIIAGIWLASRLRRWPRRRSILTILTVVTVASLVSSIVLTTTAPSIAYFITPTRAWEFGLGGLLAVVVDSFDGRFDRLRPFVAWAGWIAIAIAVFRFTAGTPFPGYTALLPVGGALAVIWAGSPRQRWAPTALAGIRPVQWTGDVSYSIYLWHWPLLIVAPYALGHATLTLVEKLVLLASTVVLAWLTRRWVEDPVRKAPLLSSRKPRWTFLAAGVAMLIVVVPSVAGSSIVQANQARDAGVRKTLTASSCFGAASMDPTRDCSHATFPVLSPDPALAPQDSPDIYFTDPPCFATGTTVATCSFGDPTSSTRVALIGDSHAAQWEPALRELAEKHGWDLELYLKTNCAFTDAQRSAQYAPCAAWSSALQKKLAASKSFDVVLTSFFADNLNIEVGKGLVSRSAAEAGFQQVWQPLVDRGSTIIVIHDTPHMSSSTTVCVATKGSSKTCDVPSAAALAAPDLQYAAAANMAGVLRLDLNDWLCTPSICKAVIGGVAVRTDPYHITKTYSQTMTPYLYQELQKTIGKGEVPSSLAKAFAP